MNAAVLFDSAEEDTRLRHPKIHGQEKILQYVFYDVRYPMVTEGMISQAIQKAAEYEVALFGREEDMPDEMGETGMLGNLRFYSYPAAVSAKSPALHCLHEPRHILRNLLEYEPYICKTERYNFPVYDAEDIQRAESVMPEPAAVHNETR